MFLLFPLIFGCCLAVIPVVIHLLHRQKTTPISWGAMQFLEESALQERRRKNIDHWLLMLIRMAVLAVLAVLLARPMTFRWFGSSLQGAGAPADIAVVVDHTLSMGRRADHQTLLEHAGDTLERIHDLMRPTDTLSVVLAEHSPRLLTPLPIQKAADYRQLRQALRELRPGLTDGSIPEAIGAARELLNKGRHARKILFVVSDEQRSGWQVEGEGPWRAALGDRLSGPDKDLKVFAVPVPYTGKTSNLSVGGLNLEPGLVGVGRPIQITATVANAGPNDMPASPVQLIVDGRSVTTQQTTPLPTGQAQSLRFDYTFTEAGSHWVKVQLDAVDALEADNSALAALDVWQRLPVLIVDGDLSGAGEFRSSAFLQAALQPVDQPAEANTLIQPKTISGSDVERVVLADYAAVILNDVPRLPGAFVNRLSDYAQSGHGVWIILGPRSEAGFVTQVLGKTPLLPATLQASTRPATPPALEVREPENPMVALLLAAQRNAFVGAAVTQWWTLTAAGNQHVVLATTTGDPLIVAHDIGGNGGRAVVWATGIDGSWNNLPLQANFVPLVNETLFYLAAAQTHTQRYRLDAGQPIVWSAPATPAVEAVTLLKPDGQTLKLQAQLRGDKYIFNYHDTFVPGLYELRFQPGVIPQPVRYAVNLDRRELDPAVLSGSDVETLQQRRYLQGRLAPPSAEVLAGAMGAEYRGTELWPYLAVLVLVLLFWETYLTRRMVRLQSGGDGAGLPGQTAPGGRT